MFSFSIFRMYTKNVYIFCGRNFSDFLSKTVCPQPFCFARPGIPTLWPSFLSWTWKMMFLVLRRRGQWPRLCKSKNIIGHTTGHHNMIMVIIILLWWSCLIRSMLPIRLAPLGWNINVCRHEDSRRENSYKL